MAWLVLLSNLKQKIKKLLQLDLQKRDYVSETDQFLAAQRAKIPLSKSQLNEIAKNKKIAKARDIAQVKNGSSISW